MGQPGRKRTVCLPCAARPVPPDPSVWLQCRVGACSTTDFRQTHRSLFGFSASRHSDCTTDTAQFPVSSSPGSPGSPGNVGPDEIVEMSKKQSIFHFFLLAHSIKNKDRSHLMHRDKCLDGPGSVNESHASWIKRINSITLMGKANNMER